MFFSKILRGIQDVAEEAGYNVMVSNTDQRPGKEKSVIETLMSMRIDGLIIASPTMTDQRYISYLKDCGVPIVILMRNWEDFDMVISDNNLGGYLSAEYLLRTGSKKIYYLLLPQVSKVGEDRLRGHIRALNEYGIEFRPEQVKRTIPSIDGGAESMKELLKNGFDGDAICCDCDLIAVGAMNELQKAGYKIPDQVRVCGFNDLELSPYVRHPLTTIRQNRYDIGREGAILLLDKIKYNNKLTRKVILPVELIIREST
jgi:LacI family transcriptional regulator